MMVGENGVPETPDWQPEPTPVRRSPLNRSRKSGHIFTRPGEVCWCRDEHYEIAAYEAAIPENVILGTE